MSYVEQGTARTLQPLLPAGVRGDQYAYADRPVATGHCVRFGRTSGVSEADRAYLVQKFNGPSPHGDLYVDVTKRLHQYYNDPRAYVLFAIQSERKLTGHEWDVYWHWDEPGGAADISIAHILGSGLVQNLLNRMILQFRDGRAFFEPADGAADSARSWAALAKAQAACARAETRFARAEAAGEMINAAGSDAGQIRDDARERVATAARPVVQALATQAAAVARLRGIGRAIIAEEPVAHGYGEKLDPANATTDDKINLMAWDVDIVLGNHQARPQSAADAAKQAHGANGPDPQRQRAYLSYMMHTVDSPGNLRLGSRQGNNIVGAGFDMPLTGDLEPTDRGLRLYAALKTYGLPDMEECTTVEACGDTYHTGHFTTDTDGRRLSSSVQIDDSLNAQAIEEVTRLKLEIRP